MAWRIRTVSERTGVNVETLRSWERRYEFIRPVRNVSGYRVYSDDDVAVIGRVKSLIDEGLKISEAVEQVRREGLLADADPADGDPTLPGTLPGVDVDAVIPPPPRPGPTPERRRRPPAPRAEPGLDLEAPPPRHRLGGALGASFRALIEALLDIDRPRVEAILAALPPLSWDRLARDLLLPAAREIAARRRGGAATFVPERFAQEVVRERLRAMLAALGGGPPAGPEAVCIGAPGEDAELGLLGSALHLALTGWRVTCLGADFPPGELATWLSGRRPGLLMVSVVRPRVESERRELLRRLRMLASPTTRVVAGGAGARGDGTVVEGVAIARTFDDLPTP